MTRTWRRPLGGAAGALLALLATAATAAASAADSAAVDSLRAPADTVRAADSLAAPAPADSAAVRVPARADTSDALERFLRQLADSTGRTYRAATAPLDTAGLDSALFAGLERGPSRGSPRRARAELWPWFEFSRVEAAVMGGRAAVGPRAGIGRISGALAWANGPNFTLGNGGYEKTWGRARDGNLWRVEGWAGRAVELIDLDRHRQLFSTMSAFIAGNDLQHYVRLDGARLSLLRQGLRVRWQLAWRDQLESPLETTATWNLAKSSLEAVGNLPATLGRNSEFRLTGALRPMRWPLWLEGHARLGYGDFEYRRLRVSAAADLPVSRWATVLPQVTWGALDGDIQPQNAFWLGGPSSLRSLSSYSASGDHLLFGRLEMVIAKDIVEMLHLPLGSAVNLQPALFVASGSVWGTDPFSGLPAAGGGWPEDPQWRHEAGFGLYYRPGLPNPDGFLRFVFAHPLGPNDNGYRIVVSYSRPLDQLRFRGDDE